MALKVKKKLRMARYMKRATRGFKGYPAASVAWYGPNADKASKVVVGILYGESQEPEHIRKWTHASRDVRRDSKINSEIDAFIEEHSVASIALARRIVGCPHESEIDYEGDYCDDPGCSYWVGRERWTGKLRGE
jgi:hypothetical protein